MVLYELWVVGTTVKLAGDRPFRWLTLTATNRERRVMKTKLEKEKGLEQPKEMLPPTSHRRRPPEKTKNSPEIAYTAGDRRETKRSKGNEVGEENN